jgi:hypothetical protein
VVSLIHGRLELKMKDRWNTVNSVKNIHCPS